MIEAKAKLRETFLLFFIKKRRHHKYLSRIFYLYTMHFRFQVEYCNLNEFELHVLKINPKCTKFDETLQSCEKVLKRPLGIILQGK